MSSTWATTASTVKEHVLEEKTTKDESVKSEDRSGDEETVPWTKEEFAEFNCVGRWTFDENITEITAYIFDKQGPRKLENSDFKEFISLNPESSPAIKIYLTTGVTGSAAPVQITQDDFSYWNRAVGVPKALLKTRAISDDMGFLEYMTERDGDGEIESMSFVCDWAPYGDVYIWFIARMDYRTNVLSVLVSSKKPLDHDFLMTMMTDKHELLLDEPLHFIGLLWTAAASWCRNRTRGNVRELLEIEAEIGVTIDMDYFRSRDYKLNNEDFEDINARLFGETKSIATHVIYVNHLRDFSSTLLDILQNVHASKKRKQWKDWSKEKGGDVSFSEFKTTGLGREGRGTYELEYLDKRLRAVTHNLNYCNTISQTLFQVLYNRMLQRDARLNYKVARAAKQDSSAMKTISILTLTFLPMTAVSAVFSGTMFDFSNWDIPGEHVASGGWWVFVVSCIISTIVTVAVWYVWLYTSERKIDWMEEKERQKIEEEKSAAPEDSKAEEEKNEGTKEDVGTGEGGEEVKEDDGLQSLRKRPTGFTMRSRKSTRYSVSDVV
jgi:hypothetical protein